MSIAEFSRLCRMMLFGAGALTIVTISARADAPIGRDLDVSTFKEIDAALGAQRFRGVVLVARGDSVVYRSARGRYRIGSPDSIGPATAFHIGSLTKAFTATAVLRLVKDGRLTLDDPIERFVPGLPNGRQITIRQLLDHTAGLPELTKKDYDRWAMTDVSLETIFQELAKRPASRKPGTKFKYANEDYLVLGSVLERVTGSPWDAALRQLVLEPLGLRSTRYVSSPERDSGLAQGLRANGSPAPLVHMALAATAGGLTSTAEDVWRLNRAIDHAELIGPEMRREMFKKQASEYGFGWVISNRFSGECYWHNGTVDGYFAFAVRFPGDDLSIVVLSGDERPVGPLVKQLAAIALGEVGTKNP